MVALQSELPTSSSGGVPLSVFFRGREESDVFRERSICDDAALRRLVGRFLLWKSGVCRLHYPGLVLGLGKWGRRHYSRDEWRFSSSPEVSPIVVGEAFREFLLAKKTGINEFPSKTGIKCFAWLREMSSLAEVP